MDTATSSVWVEWLPKGARPAQPDKPYPLRSVKSATTPSKSWAGYETFQGGGFLPPHSAHSERVVSRQIGSMATVHVAVRAKSSRSSRIRAPGDRTCRQQRE